jgi:flagellar biogenesis protein FliO
MQKFFIIFFLLFSSMPLRAATIRESSAIEMLQEEAKKEEKQELSFGYVFIKMMIILCITLSILLIGVWFSKNFLTKRLQQKNLESRIQIIERRQLAPKVNLWVVRIDHSDLLISEHPSGIALLKDLSHLHTRGESTS